MPNVSDSIGKLCRSFVEGKSRPRYVFGCSPWGQSIGDQVSIAAYVDDYTKSSSYCGKPVVHTDCLEEGALVVSAVVGVRPISVKRRLARAGIENLDYFEFMRYSGLRLKPPMIDFEAFGREYQEHRPAYDGIFERLSDRESRLTWTSIVNFRLNYDLHHMVNFADRQHEQYFEPFLALKPDGETFVDVGGFDGFTTTEFMRRCPGFEAVHLFEPEAGNLALAKEKLSPFQRIQFHPIGLSDRSQHLRFDVGEPGNKSASRVSETGIVTIEVAPLDDVVTEPISFIKMDIEGCELAALRGCRETIRKYHPRLAVAAYHLHDDLRTIAETVLGIRNDYRLYLRHYTEGVTETVMFFVPETA